MKVIAPQRRGPVTGEPIVGLDSQDGATSGAATKEADETDATATADSQVSSGFWSGSSVVYFTQAPSDHSQIPAGAVVPPGGVAGGRVSFSGLATDAPVVVVTPGAITGGPVTFQGLPTSAPVKVVRNADSQIAAPVSLVTAQGTHNLGTSVLITDANLTSAARFDAGKSTAPQALLAGLMDSRVMAVLALTLAAANYRKGRRAGAMGMCDATQMDE
jgi:hypothetical protein